MFVRTRIEGTVELSDATGCVELLDGNGVRWVLVGERAELLTPGRRVRLTVRGVPESQAPPACAGGPVVRVEKITVLPG